MSDLKQALTGHIKKIAFQKQVLRATVVSNDKAKRICHIKLDNGIEVDVLLQPYSEQDKGKVVYPKPDTRVTVEKIEGKDMALKLHDYTEVEEVNFKLDDLNINIDKKGIKAENQGEDLKTIMNDHFKRSDDYMEQMKALMDELNKVVVIIGNPVNVGAVSAIKAQVSQLQDENNSIKTRFNKIIC